MAVALTIATGIVLLFFGGTGGVSLSEYVMQLLVLVAVPTAATFAMVRVAATHDEWVLLLVIGIAAFGAAFLIGLTAAVNLGLLRP